MRPLRPPLTNCTFVLGPNIHTSHIFYHILTYSHDSSMPFTKTSATLPSGLSQLLFHCHWQPACGSAQLMASARGPPTAVAHRLWRPENYWGCKSWGKKLSCGL